MYHCHLHIYLAGRSCRAFEMIKELPPAERFTHEFRESERLEDASGADVVFVNLSGMRPEELSKRLLSDKAGSAEWILLAEKEQLPPLEGVFTKLKDIWTYPLSDGEIRFHLLRWQQACKKDRDFWQTEHYLEATINNVPNLIWYKNKEGIHEKVNDCFCKTVNKTRAQVEGRDHYYIWDVAPAEMTSEASDCSETDLAVMQKRETCVSEEIVKTGDGVKRLMTYKSPLFDLDGSVMGTVGVAIDVTQERAYEQELISKSRVLEAIFTTMDCGVLCHSMDGTRILSVNQAALNILGYSSAQQLKENGFDMVAASVLDEDKGALRESMLSLKNPGDSVSVSYRVQHENGDVLHVMGNVKLIEEDGELLYQRFLLDCTAQKLEEEKEKRRQLKLIQALSTDYTVVCHFDLDTGKGRSLRVNDDSSALASVFEGEVSLEESMERYIREFVYEDDREMLRQEIAGERMREELADKNQRYVNYRIRTNGKIEYYEMKTVRAGKWGENYDVVLGLRSVDEETRREMEQRSLLEDALLQANRASRAKSAFLSNMSHDIRTPMNAIVGFTALALTHVDDRALVGEYLKKIMMSGNHLLSLINDVLDMSRIESGKMHLDEKPCSLADILHGLHDIVQADIHAKQLELFIDTVDVVDEEIYCDKLRLNQVLLNLLSNAVKYTGAGGIVSMRVTERPGAVPGHAKYEFCIKDTGIGMSEEFVTHIFEPFVRERNTTISGIQGTGLGMAITKNIVDMMNGSIEVKSEQGKGTEVTAGFTFRLASMTAEPQAIPELKNCRALVVDDDFNTCDSVSYMLTQIGMRAEWTLSGKEAVLRTRQALMRDDIYSVYIIDWLLPDMNGIEVTRRIRKEMGEDVPIIVLTAYDWSDIKEEAQEAGVTAFCSKPLFLSELRSCLYTIVAKEDEAEQEEQEPVCGIRSGRILMAEDNELNQEIAVAILEDAGFEVEIAENGQIAVEMLQNALPGYYQLVLMDVQMPVMNGYEATRRIRALENRELASIPILAMTANAFEEDRQEALDSGMNGHIAKPIDIGNLFAALDEVLRSAARQKG